MSLNKRFIKLLASVLAMPCVLWSCHDADSVMSNDVIAQNDEFTVTGDSVTEGDHVATALSDRHITTNFEWQTDPKTAPDVLEFRLAINGQDNELPMGKAHYVRLGQDTTFCYGEADDKAADDAGKPGAKGGGYTVRVDMSRVLEAFKKQGYYVGARGDTTFSSDFGGVWIAGGQWPLTDEMRALREERKYKLSATADPNVYAVKIDAHSTAAKTEKCHDWHIDKLNEDFPQYHSSQMLVDALYNMAIDDVARGVERGGKAATREAYVPIYLSLAYLAPEYSKALLKLGVDGDSLLRNESWPVMSDHALWAVAAWEVYAVTGDKEWLKYAFGVASKTLLEDLRVMMNRPVGLMRGVFCQNYGLGFRTLYPQWMDGADLFETMSLGNNVAYQAAFDALGQMADALGSDDAGSADVAARLKEAVNQRFWDENAGMYRGVAYCNPGSMLLPVTDNFAQALSVLFGIADDDRAETLVARTPIPSYGVPMMFPGVQGQMAGQLTNAEMQALWNIAAAHVGNENALRRGLGAMWRAAALFGGYRNYYACYGNGSPLDGEKPHSVAAAAGCAAMVFRVIAGMNFLPNGIEFDPTVPECLKGTKRIVGFRYRRSTLDISIEGTGNDIGEMFVDDAPAADNFLPDTLTGHHVVRIVMARSGNKTQNVALTSKPHVLPTAPIVAWNGAFGRIVNYAAGNGYRIVVNGTQNYSVVDSTFKAPFSRGMNVAAMVCVNKDGVSQISRPYVYAGGMRTFVAETANANMNDSTAVVRLNVNVSGRYYADISYANGSDGLWCSPGCVVEVSANTHLQGFAVTPTLGSGVWKKTGHSSVVELDLVKGDNVVTLKKLTGGAAVRLCGLRLLGK